MADSIPARRSKAERRLARRKLRERKRLLKGRSMLSAHGPFVDHPRYGDRPIVSGERHSPGEVRRAHWSYGRVNDQGQALFPETAIRANPCRQYAGYGWRTLYVDIARRCRGCGRWFLFFALEQKYWFEELGFFIDADCVHCQPCRHESHGLKRAVARHAELLGRGDKTRGEWDELARLGDYLFETGHITRPETLARTRMPRRLARGMAR